jgi:capsular polysaccharide biosynthesis protein
MVGLSSIVGLALGLAIAFALELANNTLRTRSDVEYYLGVPVLAVIPDAKSRQLALAGTAEGLVRR